MKLRFDHQSIRLRLRRSDVAALQQHETVQTSVTFPTGQLTYQLTLNSALNTLMVTMQEGVITVEVPLVLGLQWIDSDQVGLYETLFTGTEKNLEVIIEKDFPCQHGSAADNADTFSDLQNS
jgi:hypothetical protein